MRLRLVLIGPHGVGKSTVGRALASHLGLPFSEELGEALARDPRWRPAGQDAAQRAEQFDEELFNQELMRDQAVSGPRVIETWHPGNLAYAGLRSPAVAARWRDRIRACCRAEPTLVLPLRASAAVLARRQHEPGDPRFFRQVGAEALRWADWLGLPCLSPLDTGLQAPGPLALALAQQVHAWASAPRTQQRRIG